MKILYVIDILVLFLMLLLIFLNRILIPLWLKGLYGVFIVFPFGLFIFWVMVKLFGRYMERQ